MKIEQWGQEELKKFFGNFSIDPENEHFTASYNWSKYGFYFHIVNEEGTVWDAGFSAFRELDGDFDGDIELSDWTGCEEDYGKNVIAIFDVAVTYNVDSLWEHVASVVITEDNVLHIIEDDKTIQKNIEQLFSCSNVEKYLFDDNCFAAKKEEYSQALVQIFDLIEETADTNPKNIGITYKEQDKTIIFEDKTDENNPIVHTYPLQLNGNRENDKDKSRQIER